MTISSTAAYFKNTMPPDGAWAAELLRCGMLGAADVNEPPSTLSNREGCWRAWRAATDADHLTLRCPPPPPPRMVCTDLRTSHLGAGRSNMPRPVTGKSPGQWKESRCFCKHEAGGSRRHHVARRGSDGAYREKQAVLGLHLRCFPPRVTASITTVSPTERKKARDWNQAAWLKWVFYWRLYGLWAIWNTSSSSVN